MNSESASVLREISAVGSAARAKALAGLDPAATRRIDQDVQDLIRKVDTGMGRRRYNDLPADLLETLDRQGAVVGRLLLANLLVDAPGRASLRDIPLSILRELLVQAIRIAASMDDGGVTDDFGRNDVFLKDLGLCRLECFPCVAQVVEQHRGYSKALGVSGGPAQFAALAGILVRNGLRNAPYLELHTHTPMLDGFNPDGWNRCYELSAELLAHRPDHLGVVSSSWFYDPALSGISPRLAYLREVQQEGGAILLRSGSSQEDTNLATSTSETRRKLFAQGKYIPTKYTLVWSRQRLIDWARRRKSPNGQAAK